MKNIFLVLIVLASKCLLAQESIEKKSKFFSKENLSITASVAHTKDIPLYSAIGIPNVFSNPIRPWYALGIEKAYSKKDKSKKYVGLEFNFHDYKYIDKSIGLTLTGGFERKLFKELYLGMGIGLGFQLAKRADIVYKYENGEWNGSPIESRYQYNRQSIRLGAEIGYNFIKSNISVFAGSNIMLLRNVFGPDVPLGLYQTPIKIGIKINL